MSVLRRAGLLAALTGTPLALAYRFAIIYRRRAGIPTPEPPRLTPADLGLAFESTAVGSDGVELPAWFIPAADGRPGPAVLLVHGWESSRDRTLPFAVFLHAAGFHCLTFDVRGHGANPVETLPVSAGEFARDAGAAFRTMLARPEVTIGAISGHSLGAIGALVAASRDPDVAAVVSTAAPADPLRLTRQTFHLAHLPFPDVVAYPLAWLTTRVFLRPRGHRVANVSASTALRRYGGPVLLAHGSDDAVVPIDHYRRLVRLGEATRAGRSGTPPPESFVVAGGHHSWQYESPDYREAVARFLARSLGGPLSPDAAGALARAADARRLPNPDQPFTAIAEAPGHARTLLEVVGGRPGTTPATRDAAAEP